MDLGSSTEGTQLTKHVIKKKKEKRESYVVSCISFGRSIKGKS